MADYRSKSYNGGNMQIEPYYGPPSTTRPQSYDYRSYSVSYTSSSTPSTYGNMQIEPYHAAPPPPPKLKKGKSTNSGSSSWSFKDSEFQRKRRVASYKVYSVEGKVKGSFRKSFRWIKDSYTKVVYGYWW